MCLYRVNITWNPPQWEPSQAKQPGQFPTPSIRLIHCKVDVPSNILNETPGLEHPDQSLPFSNPVYALTRLEIMPGQVDSPVGSTASPWILAVFSKPLHAPHEYPEQHGPSSIMIRWHLESVPQTLHPKFDEVTAKKNNAQAKVRVRYLYFLIQY